ncbi:MAG: tyrosine recombinase XerC [Prevotellaceae bacterium]|jgi:integrase/recombinase XerC|nr:tyrosine recombinase XerC [Prevotellaceae bacterium]
MTDKVQTYKEQFLNYMKAEKRCSQHTLKAYGNDISGFLEHVCVQQAVDFEEIDVAAVRRWIMDISHSGLSPRSVNRKISAASSLFKYLMRRKTVSHNPLSGIAKPKTPKLLPTFIAEEKLLPVLDAVPENENYATYRTRIILELFYATGVRISELVNLKISDLDFAIQQIRVLGKGNKERFVPMTETIHEQLKQYLTVRQEVYPDTASAHLFLSTRGAQINVRTVYEDVKKYLRIRGITGKCNPHSLRHTFATHLLNSGADLNGLKELLGHKSLAATQIYTHNTFERLNNIYSKAHPRA